MLGMCRYVRSICKGPLLVKGILHPDEARTAVALGADGIIVSNHGGRQLDGVPSAIEALPAVVDAVGGKVCNVPARRSQYNAHRPVCAPLSAGARDAGWRRAPRLRRAQGVRSSVHREMSV